MSISGEAAFSQVAGFVQPESVCTSNQGENMKSNLRMILALVIFVASLTITIVTRAAGCPIKVFVADITQ
jgi:hypothetical protein